MSSRVAVPGAATPLPLTVVQILAIDLLIGTPPAVPELRGLFVVLLRAGPGAGARRS